MKRLKYLAVPLVSAIAAIAMAIPSAASASSATCSFYVSNSFFYRWGSELQYVEAQVSCSGSTNVTAQAWDSADQTRATSSGHNGADAVHQSYVTSGGNYWDDVHYDFYSTDGGRMVVYGNASGLSCGYVNNTHEVCSRGWPVKAP